LTNCDKLISIYCWFKANLRREAMSDKVKIPYAVSNYEKIIREGYYIIDKTKYLSYLEQYTAPVFLRPRRFGKTLFCSIQECYYDINRADVFDELFGNTWIGENPTKEKNSCMVMRFNFSKIKVSLDIEKIEHNFNILCRTVYENFVVTYQNYFNDFQYEKDDASTVLGQILNYIKTYHLPPAYIIIDEYDNFTNQLIQSNQESLYKTIMTGDSFLRTFFKVVKAGTDDLSVRRCYLTGVLPITIDDLTSGFNIAEILTLEKPFANMMGFSQLEVQEYLKKVFSDYGFDPEQLSFISNLVMKYYNGYRFVPESETLYNSTIITFFLKKLIINNGEIPVDFIDDNIKTDSSWIKRLTGGSETASKKLLEQLIFEGEITYDYEMLRSKFNMSQFFQEDFYPVSMFYLGMLTLKDDYSMTFPNQTMKKIVTDYFNEIERISVSIDYVKYFQQFIKDLDLIKLFAGYFERYIGQIPAQACDKMNENFYRTTFFELCTRYLSRNFVFTIETNYPSGRSDWEMLGKFHTQYKNMKWLVEFKHFTNKEAKKNGIYDLQAPLKEEVLQVEGYAKDILAQFPEYQIRKFVIYTISCETFRAFELKEEE